MKPSTHNQKGFSAIEGLLIIIIVLFVGFIGYYVWYSQKQTTKTYSTSATPTQSSPSKKTMESAALTTLQSDGKALETLQIPSSWTATVAHKSIDPSLRQAACSITASSNLTALDYGSAMPTTLANKTNNSFDVEFDIVKQPDSKPLQSYFTDDLYGGYDAGIHTFTDMTIHGNPAVLYNGSGEPDGSDYKQQYYLIAHNGYVGCLRWRYFDNGGAGGSGSYDYSSYKNQVEAIAKSIQFPN